MGEVPMRDKTLLDVLNITVRDENALQAIAAFRQSVRIAALEEAAGVAEAYKPTDNGDPGDYGAGLYNGGIEASEHIATAIRERIDQ